MSFPSSMHGAAAAADLSGEQGAATGERRLSAPPSLELTAAQRDLLSSVMLGRMSSTPSNFDLALLANMSLSDPPTRRSSQFSTEPTLIQTPSDELLSALANMMMLNLRSPTGLDASGDLQLQNLQPPPQLQPQPQPQPQSQQHLRRSSDYADRHAARLLAGVGPSAASHPVRYRRSSDFASVNSTAVAHVPATSAPATYGIMGLLQSPEHTNPVASPVSPTSTVSSEGLSVPLGFRQRRHSVQAAWQPDLPTVMHNSPTLLPPIGSLLPSVAPLVEDHAPSSQSRTAPHPLYKTEMCRTWEQAGDCQYGDKCQFAHGKEELRQVQRHPKYKTKVCHTFLYTGTCPYGHRCRFIHGTEAEGQASPN